ncbi:MAG: hypothetical protein FGM14_15410 [Flavobacteriales bacterium]|nr:hypothetical protein [Flavobacteriales bacterium]
MKNYYRLVPWTDEKGITIDEITGIESFKDTYYDGKLISLKETPFIHFENLKKQPLDFLTDYGFRPIVSLKMKQILEDQKDDFPYLQFIPLKSKLKKEYFFLQILENIHCFDWEKSEYTRHPEFLGLENIPDKVSKLVMHHEKIGTRNIFRMAEKSTKIFVSDSLANILTANNITGMRITKSPNLDRLYDAE